MGLKHYCGIFGIYGHPDSAELTSLGLHALQHRSVQMAPGRHRSVWGDHSVLRAQWAEGVADDVVRYVR